MITQLDPPHFSLFTQRTPQRRGASCAKTRGTARTTRVVAASELMRVCTSAVAGIGHQSLLRLQGATCTGGWRRRPRQDCQRRRRNDEGACWPDSRVHSKCTSKYWEPRTHLPGSESRHEGAGRRAWQQHGTLAAYGGAARCSLRPAFERRLLPAAVLLTKSLFACAWRWRCQASHRMSSRV